jgi:two-component system, chemotaxis family, chemotaxis protein CheY
MKLLIVDDSLIVRNAIQRCAVRGEITEIFQAQDGQEAIDLFLQHQPELVTMDLTMPRVDGLGCLAKLRDMNADASILVISALNSHATAMKAISLGACGFLVKPFTPVELSEALLDLIGHAAGILD